VGQYAAQDVSGTTPPQEADLTPGRGFETQVRGVWRAQGPGGGGLGGLFWRADSMKRGFCAVGLGPMH
jgi:hypothetical protein